MPCITAAPAALDRYPRGITGHVAHPIRSIRLGYGGKEMFDERRSLAISGREQQLHAGDRHAALANGRSTTFD